MAEAVVTAPVVEIGALESAGGRLEAPLRIGGTEHRLWYAAGDLALAQGADAALAAALPVAMRRGEPLRVLGAVSPRLLEAVSRIQAIFNAWDRRYRIVEVVAERDRPEPPRAEGTASFFTGGVDSWYTALRHRSGLEALVYVHGFDVPLDDAERRRQVSGWLRDGAAALEIPLVEVETNLRELTRRICGWHLYHGPALASVALLLAARFDRVMLPATHTYRDLMPLGSHPLLDPLWSTESLELVHEGAENRVVKLALLSEFEPAFSSLRACWQEDTIDHNCGRCEKCLRTMAALRLLGRLEAAPTFPDRLPLRRLRGLALSPGKLAYVHELIDAAERYGPDPALERTLQSLLRRGPRRYERQEKIRSLRRDLRQRRRKAARRIRRRVRSG